MSALETYVLLEHDQCMIVFVMKILRGQGGVPWVQIIENEFKCLVVRGGDGGHFAEKFVEKYCSYS